MLANQSSPVPLDIQSLYALLLFRLTDESTLACLVLIVPFMTLLC